LIEIKGIESGIVSFKYEGTIKNIINEVNMINSRLVELARYSGWYPFNKTSGTLKFEL